MKVWSSEKWGRKFEDCVNWEVENGKDILFWSDNWVTSGDLKSRFPRLFSLSVLKEANIRECGSKANGVWEWNLRWRRGLFTWEEDQVSQLLETISNRGLSQR